MTWTCFMDTHSGGSLKLEWQYIYIEAPLEEAIAFFQKHLGRDPTYVTCGCCGNDYAISEEGEDLAQATGHERGCEFDGEIYLESGCRHATYLTLAEYINSEKAKFFYKAAISLSDKRKRLCSCTMQSLMMHGCTCKGK